MASRRVVNVALVNPPTLDHGRVTRPAALRRTGVPYYRWRKVMCGEYGGRSTIPGEHLGLQSLAASLRAAGHRVRIVNACAAHHGSLDDTLDAIRAAEPRLVGFSGPLEVLAENVWLADALRAAGFDGHVTLGHDFATLNHKAILGLYPSFDSVVRGEGERSIVELADRVAAGVAPDDVDGVSFRSGGTIVATRPRAVVESLDELPWVARDDLPAVLGAGFAASVWTQRGCPYRCSFCTTPHAAAAEGSKGPLRWRRRAPEAVVDEIERLRRHGVDWVTIVDDLYLAKGAAGTRHALAVADELLRRDVRVEYMVDCRVDGIEEDVFAHLRASGLRRVFVGVESAAGSTLAYLRKGYRAELVAERLDILRRLDIDVVLGYILWSPHEDLPALRASHEFLKRLEYRDVAVFFEPMVVYPGTPVCDDLRAERRLRGEFPYYSFDFADAPAGRLFEELERVWQMLAPALARGCESLSLDGRRLDVLFDIVDEGFHRLLECCERADDDGFAAASASLYEDVAAVVAEPFAMTEVAV